MRQGLVYLFLLLVLAGCTYEERKCEFQSQASAPVELQDFKSEYLLTDTLVIVQDYMPARQNGRVILFPADADLSWQLNISNGQSYSIPASMFQFSAELGTAVSLNGNGSLKITPVREGNQFRLRLKLKMNEPGFYNLNISQTASYEENLIPAGKYQNCVEKIALRTLFSQLPADQYAQSIFQFRILP